MMVSGRVGSVRQRSFDEPEVRIGNSFVLTVIR